MISRLKIENFKSIKEVNLELKNINILIGSNGAGKSNFILFLKLLNSLTQERLQYYIGENGGANNILYYGLKESSYLDCRIFLKENDVTSYYEFSLTPDTEGRLFFTKETFGYRREKIYSNYFVYHDNIASGGLETNISKSLNENTRNIRPLVNRRLKQFKVYHFHDTGKTAKVKQAFNINDNKELYEDACNLASFLYRLKIQDELSLKKIEKTIQLIAPYFDRFELEPDFRNEEMIKIGWKEKNSDMLFNASHLSDGTLRMICLITLFMQPDPPQTIVLDEPELGLHPFALQVLSDLIKKVAVKDIQVIISTQSVPLIEKFDIDDIVVVEKYNKESKFNRLSIEELKDWLEDYSIGELWEKNLLGGRP